MNRLSGAARAFGSIAARMAAAARARNARLVVTFRSPQRRWSGRASSAARGKLSSPDHDARRIRRGNRALLPRRRVEIQPPLDPGARRLGPGRIEHVRHGSGFDDPPGMEEDEVVAEPPCLPDIVRDQHDGDAAFMRLPYLPFDRVGRGRIEARRRLVQEQHPRFASQRAGDRQALLLASGQHARGLGGQTPQPCPLDRFRFPAARSAPRTRRTASAKRRLARTDRRSMTGRWNTIACPRRPSRSRGPSPPPDLARGRPDQAVQQPQQQALSGAVGPHDHGAATGPEVDVDVVDEPLAAGIEAQAPGLKKRRRRSVHRCRRPRRGHVERRLTHRPTVPRRPGAPSPRR